ncbi:MAG: hypothetical protein EHM28_02030 [Spirochaetaceae bacterium]|nr:MAG: hypothetical protein EHM28_02030 [Spirochaetaceae bacterium]
MARKNLGEAKQLFQKRKYQDVIRILEPQVFAFRDSFPFYYLLGLSCFFQQDKSGAYSYLHRANQLDENNINILLGLAVIHLRRRNQDEALKIWLKIKDMDPQNKTAARGLELLRRGLDDAGLDELFSTEKVRSIYPPEAFRFPLVPVLSGAVVCAIAVLLVFFIPALISMLNPLILPEIPEGRKDVESVQVPSGTAYVESAGQERITFTEYEAQAVFDEAKRLFLEYRDNRGVVQCNRLINSNASRTLKEFARRLKSVARTPGFKDFLNFPDNYTYEEVVDSPYLYDGCFVIWRGTVANLQIRTMEIGFQFLKGSWDNKVFDGNIPVIFHEATKLENDYYIELLGKVVTSGNSFSLEGVLQRRIIPDSP